MILLNTISSFKVKYIQKVTVEMMNSGNITFLFSFICIYMNQSALEILLDTHFLRSELKVHFRNVKKESL